MGGSNGGLYGLDPATGATRFSANLNGYEHFTTPSAAGGLLFVANKSGSSNDQITALRIAKPPRPSATTVSVSSSSNPGTVGHPVTLTATVAPVPDAGTVAFTDDGAPITGCGAIPLNVATAQAACTTTFTTTGTHGIVGNFSGDAYYLPASGSLEQSVVSNSPAISHPPAISHLRVRLVHRKLRLSITLSAPAELKIVVFKLVLGRMVHRRGRAGAEHGRRCEATVKKLTFRLHTQAGADVLHLRMRPLPPGRYLVTVTAFASNGAHSRPRSALVTVRRG